MANEEQLDILKQGAEAWNQWRNQNPGIQPDLTEATLNGADLVRANLKGAFMYGIHLRESNLNSATLRNADLRRADLRGAQLLATSFNQSNLTEADLSGAAMFGAGLGEALLEKTNLREVVLYESYCEGAIFQGTDLGHSDLRYAILTRAQFTGADLAEADMSYAILGNTTFSSVDLSTVIGMEHIEHNLPSHISTSTMQRSRGRIQDDFAMGCGLTDWEIEQMRLYNPDLSNDEINRILYKLYDLRAGQALQISPLFISYSHVNREFVDKLEHHLRRKGIRFWRDIHDLKAGRIETQIDHAIQQDRTVVLVLSEHSLKSDWVEHEVRTARQFEKDTERDVLCPIALDDSWKDSRWPKRLMEQIKEYNILDFSEWEDDVKFEDMFRKLIDGLKLFYKG